MKIFLTGGTGFIGSRVIKQALAAGHEVTALRLPGERPKIELPVQPRWVEGSLADNWEAELQNVQAIVHLAAVGVSPQKATWEQLFQVNVCQSINLLARSVQVGVRRLVVCGSCFEFGRCGERFDFIPPDAPLEPANAYAASKAAASLAALALCIESRVEMILLRPFHVFGEGQHPSNFWPALKAAAMSGQDFPMTLGGQIRDFAPVEQAAAAFVNALDRPGPQPGRPVVENIGTGRPQTLLAFAEYWWREWQAKGRLLPGALPYRDNEVMRYVPEVPAGQLAFIPST